MREHDHGHDHEHDQDDGHDRAPPARTHAGHDALDATRPFALALLANLAYTAVEAGIGFRIDSLALLSDALHNLGDALGLALAWGAARLAMRPATARHTYGWRRATHLSPLANALLLVAFSGALIGESLRRFADPGPVPGGIVMLVAAIGIVVNLGSAALLHGGHSGDLNRRGAYLHLVADAAVSVAAVLAGLGMLQLGWRWLDPAMGLGVSVVIVVGSWGLLRDSFRQVMDAVPAQLDPAEVQAFIKSLTGVDAVHHLHIWAIGSREIALTAHIERGFAEGHDAFLKQVGHALDERFGINHATIQIECGPGCTAGETAQPPHH